MNAAAYLRTHVLTSADGRVDDAGQAMPVAATRLDERHVLLLAGSDAEGPEVGDVRVDLQGTDAESVAWRCLGRSVEATHPRRRLVLAIARTALDAPADASELKIELHENGSGPAVTHAVSRDTFIGFRPFLRTHLAGLAADARHEALALMAAWFADRGDAPGQVTLGRKMTAARNALREPEPPCPRGAGEARGLAIEGIYALDASAFWVRGWLVDRDAEVRRLTAVSPEGQRVELLDRLHRYERPDLAELYPPLPEPPEPARGFMACFEVPGVSYQPDGWIVEMENALGHVSELLAPPVVQERAAVREALLRDFGREEPTARLGETIRPAVARLQARVHRDARISCVTQFGEAPPDPDVSIIVPLYKRVDFLEHQLAQFAHDPEVRRQDLVYVLDSPEQKDGLTRQATQLQALHGVPFRLAVMSANVGFSHANNAGASLARGGLLLFLNSDVLPDRPGWLGTMAAFYRSKRNMGALGVKLLYEDDSLQHAGMYFDPSLEDGQWANAHYFKGLDRHFGPASVSRPVPAVTGACLMVDKVLFEEERGFSGAYVQGDYEDSDLCVRLHERGLESWYLADVELYHLEAQSYPDEVRRLASRFNRWLHTHLWGPAITSLMQTHRPESTSWSAES